jgi:hypothetical protein
LTARFDHVLLATMRREQPDVEVVRRARGDSPPVSP